MKLNYTLLLLFFTSILISQECGPITAGSQFVHGNLQYNILNGNNAFNELSYKVGIGEDGDIDTREYAPILYSSNIWAGGVDPNGSVKLAAGTYIDQDWVMGPLDESGQTSAENCANWDRIFSVTKEDILKARNIFLENGPCSDIPESILNWPGRGNINLSFIPDDFRGADFWDEDGDARYDPCSGDLPIVSIRGHEPWSADDYIPSIPSQISYYVMNDNGKLHLYSGGIPTQLEVAVYIFAFKSQGLDDVIFMKQKITSKSTDDIRDFHYGNWFDFDLGCKENDYIGTDPERHMVYAYNSNEDNECNFGGTPLPKAQFGVSYLAGIYEPFIIVGDSLVTPPIGTYDVDTLVRTRMKTSVIPFDCQDNSIPNTCNPQTSNEYYNILKGSNKDGSPILDNSGNATNIMFTGNPSASDGWSLCNEDKIPETSAISSVSTGLLQPGASNEILIALFNASDGFDDGCTDIAALQDKQEIVQKFYNDGFFHYLGPLPPTIEMSQESNAITISISNIPFEYSQNIPEAEGFDDTYNFEGIKIYQVSSPNFDMNELGNLDYSALIYQGDIENGIAEADNWQTLFINGNKSFVSKRQVDGEDIGILEEVLFDYDYLNNEAIVQGKPYYFVALSYAYNNYLPFINPNGIGQQYTYLESTCGVKVLNSEVLLSETEIEESKPYLFYNNIDNWRLENTEDQLQVTLIASNGQIIKNWELNSGSSLFSQDIDGLLNGVYFLQIYSKKKDRMYVQKVIQMK